MLSAIASFNQVGVASRQAYFELQLSILHVVYIV